MKTKTENDMNPHINDIERVLKENGIDAKREEIEEKFIFAITTQKELSTKEIKQSIVGHYGLEGKFFDEFSKIKDINTEENGIDLSAKILFITERMVNTKNGEKKIKSGILGDETGTISFTSWRDMEFKKGDDISIKNATSKLWNDNAQLNINEWTDISLSDRKIENIPSRSNDKITKIGEIPDSMKNANIVGRIVDVRKKEIGTDDKKTITEGEIADSTGMLRFTVWKDMDIKKGEIYKLTNAYIKRWRGIPQLNIGDYGNIEKTSAEDIPDMKTLTSYHKTDIRSLQEGSGTQRVMITGTVMEVKDSSGYIKRCPECSRVLKDGVCSIHGSVKGIPDLRLKIIVDDGTGSTLCIINRENTEKLLEKSFADIEKEVKENSGTSEVFRDIKNRLTFETINIGGTYSSDDNGDMIVAKEAEWSQKDITEEMMTELEDAEDLVRRD